ncbi:unnamed protein product [Gordionus sp. m RMFG-2023]
MSSRIYIGRISYKAREKDIERFVRGYGKIRDITLKNGYGFVEFEDVRDADDAVFELNGKELLSERVIVELARGPTARASFRTERRPPPPQQRRPRVHNDKYGPPTRTEFRIVIENLSSRVSWQDLKDYMRQAGEVTYADAHKLRKNEGVVEFASYDDMKNAMDKLDDSDLSGRRIKLVEQYSRLKKRSRSRSRSRSRRRSRSYSKSRSASKRSRTRSRSKSSRSKSPKSDISKKSKSVSRSPSHHNDTDMHDGQRSRSKSYNANNDKYENNHDN